MSNKYLEKIAEELEKEASLVRSAGRQGKSKFDRKFDKAWSEHTKKQGKSKFDRKFDKAWSEHTKKQGNA